MKKLFFLLAAVAVTTATATTAAAQKQQVQVTVRTDAPKTYSEAGRWWVGGTVGYNSSKLDEYGRLNEFHFLPEAGYNFNDRWAVGLQLGYTHAKFKTEYNGHPAVEGFDIAPFARYTFLRWRALRVFVDGGLSIGTANGKIYDDQGDQYYMDGKLGSYALMINPGVSLRLSRCCSLVGRVNLFNISYMEATLKNRYVTDIDYIEEKVDSFNVGLNSPFTLGGFTVGFNVTF